MTAAAAVKAKQKKQIHDLHQKYYGGEKGKEPVKEPALGNTGEKAGSRADLMDQVRARGIKNFRVMNKAELAAVLDEKDQKKIDQIIAGAVARWKSGWGTKSREAGRDHKE